MLWLLYLLSSWVCSLEFLCGHVCEGEMCFPGIREICGVEYVMIFFLCCFSFYLMECVFLG